jgi:hypothetical protein
MIGHTRGDIIQHLVASNVEPEDYDDEITGIETEMRATYMMIHV